MKKLVLFSIILCFVATVSAQVRIGVKAGGNFSHLYTSDESQGLNSDQYKGRFGYHFGGMLEYSLTDMFALQPELIYMNHGANMKNNNSFGMKDGYMMLNSLQLPINAKANFNLGITKVFVYAGPYVSYNMYGKARGKVNGVSVEEKMFSDKGLDMKRWDYGFGIGVGVEYNKFILSLGNQYGAQDISGKKGHMRAGNLSLSAGYFF